jgi:hypothetical protein
MRYEQFSVNELTVNKIFNQWGAEITPGANPSGGQDYYVDGNRASAGYGGSWSDALTTLASAITLSDASIASTPNRWWARRNRIFVCADVLTENLVKFPTKCDVIGCGSYNANKKPGLSGRHIPVGEAFGTRWFNFHFAALVHASPIMTLTGGTATPSQVGFFGCDFDGTLGTMTSAILSTAMPGLEVVDCDFYGTFVTSYITFGAGEAGRAKILGNRMLGTAAKGIVVPGTTTTAWAALIQGNTIKATGDPIEEAAGVFHIVDNRLITAANIGTTTDGYTFNLALACGNILTGLNGVASTIPFAVIAE